jgi:hypothetical protein
MLPTTQRKRITPGTGFKTALRDPYLEVDVASKNLTDAGFDEFINDLIGVLEYKDAEHPQGVSKLQELHLQQNSLTVTCLAKLARVIAQSAHELKELDLSNNKIEIKTVAHRQIWKSFLDSFSNCFMLKKLDLSGNPLGPRGLEILTRVYVKSDLDFLEADGTITHSSSSVGIVGNRTIQRVGNGKENVRPDGQGQHRAPEKSQSVIQNRGKVIHRDLFIRNYPENSSHVVRDRTLSPAVKAYTEAELKHYACTRGLRSVPYLIISNISMTNGSAIHLSTMLSMHRNPERLLSFLSGGKALTLPDSVGSTKGIVWLPNDNLGSLSHELLKMTEKLGQSASDSESETDLGDSFKSLRVQDGDIKRRQMLKKLDVEHTRLTKRVRIDVLYSEGVHSAEIWSIALKMMVFARAVLLDDKDRYTGFEDVSRNRSTPDRESSEGRHTRHIREAYTPSPPQQGTFCPTTESFDRMFPSLNTSNSMSPSPSPQNPRSASNSSPASSSHTKTHHHHGGTTKSSGPNNHGNSASSPSQSRKETWRFNLPLELWRRIFEDACSAGGILDREQQLQIIGYASSWGCLAQEISIKGAAEHQQIWKILESMGCFAYNPAS